MKGNKKKSSQVSEGVTQERDRVRPELRKQRKMSLNKELICDNQTENVAKSWITTRSLQKRISPFFHIFRF